MARLINLPPPDAQGYTLAIIMKMTVEGEAVDVPAGAIAPTQVGMRYWKSDPWAVQFEFGYQVPWTFARQLLVDGMMAPVWMGVGDVQVRSQHQGSIDVKLTSEDGCSEFRFHRSPVERFLRETFDVIPLGAEHLHTNLDQEIAKLLGR